ncbi:hypothetical protein PISMIDRAFT_678369 [Pisolithus microcarpus 441]|uniref:Uncharacterized protein n=1 Tax=Pisolithus microcarpus 441 TaxID=765257 RepID=A0A0C9ZXE5_9AGAM|nr:hypothetical protein PISMIDRAFT_678369 [Pisolithus microcarpus 441]
MSKNGSNRTNPGQREGRTLVSKTSWDWHDAFETHIEFTDHSVLMLAFVPVAS